MLLTWRSAGGQTPAATAWAAASARATRRGRGAAGSGSAPGGRRLLETSINKKQDKDQHLKLIKSII